MDLAITDQSFMFSELEKDINTIDSSGNLRPAKLVYVFYDAIKSIFTHTKEKPEKIDTYIDKLEVSYSTSIDYEKKERELEKLIGKKKFNLLDRESRILLINIVGVIDFGISIDIEKTLNYSIYDEES